MQLKFQYTFDDYCQAAAQDHDGKKQVRKKIADKVLGWIIIISIACPLMVFLKLPFMAKFLRDDHAVDIALGWLGSMVFWLVLIFFPARGHRQNKSRKIWDGELHLHLPQTIDVFADGFTHWGKLWRSEYRWAIFSKYCDTPDLFLLYLSELQYVIVPKRAFETPAQMAEFQALCVNNLGGGQRGFPVLPVPPPIVFKG